VIKSQATCETGGKALKLRKKDDALRLVELRGCYPLGTYTRGQGDELYCEQLGRMYTVLKEKYLALVNMNRVLFQQDNARPHTSRRTLHNLEEFDGVKLLPHPAYSPDLVPSDFNLFMSIAHFLSGRIFDNIADVEQGCCEFFASKLKE